jgi:hypothetical protein
MGRDGIGLQGGGFIAKQSANVVDASPPLLSQVIMILNALPTAQDTLRQ